MFIQNKLKYKIICGTAVPILIFNTLNSDHSSEHPIEKNFYNDTIKVNETTSSVSGFVQPSFKNIEKKNKNKIINPDDKTQNYE